MRRPRWAGGVVAIAAIFAGCLPQQNAGHSAGWFGRMRSLTGVTTPAAEGMVLQTALVDMPAPDRFLTNDLWTTAGVTNPLTAEQSTLMELNGLRVRVTAGIPPARLMELVNSEQTSLGHMDRTMSPGQTKIIPLNGPVNRLAFAVRQDLKADPAPSEVFGAECGLAVTARPADGGRVAIRCEPQVQHGDRQQFFKPVADGSGFTRQEQKPKDIYPTLGWDMVLAPGDYLLVGTTPDPVGTLGQALFYASAGGQVRQRVLVVRAIRGNDSHGATGTTLRPTTAAAAAQATARGTAD